MNTVQKRTQAHLDEVVSELKRSGRMDLVKRLSDVVSSRRSLAPVLVVVGETKRGKSSLINALLARPGLSPVDVDVATSCTLVFHHSPTDMCRVRLASTGAIREVPFHSIFDWATVEGNPGNEKGVHSVLIGVDCPLLENMMIVDTPGVGGLDAGHGVLAAQAAAGADALLLVLDAGAPVSGPELEFLQEAAGNVDNVTIVLTKRDFRDWQVIAADDSRLLAAKSPRLAELPFLAVSSTRALDERTRPESGVEELAGHLTAQIASRADVLRYANILRVAKTCLYELLRELNTRWAAASASTETLAALESERARLDTLQTDPRAKIRNLDTELRRLTHDRADDLNRGLRELRLSYEEKASSATSEELEALPGQLLSDVTALADRLSQGIQNRLAAMMEELIADVDARPAELATLEQLVSKQLEETITLDTPRKRAANRVERLSTLVSFSSGRSIGSLVASLPIFALGGAPFMLAGLGLGAVFAFHMHKGRADVSRQSELKNWMREQLAEAERQLNNDFSRAMIDVGTELHEELGQRLDARRKEIGDAISACEAGLAMQKAQRERERAEVEGKVATLTTTLTANDQLRAEILDSPAKESQSASPEQETQAAAT